MDMSDNNDLSFEPSHKQLPIHEQKIVFDSTLQFPKLQVDQVYPIEESQSQ